MARQMITDEDIEKAKAALEEVFRVARQRNGMDSFASSHEILGCVTEEYHELIETIHLNKPHATRNELLDIAVACLFGVACIDAGKVDW